MGSGDDEWGTGRYEDTAAELAPAAAAAVAALGLRGGEHVLDVACGTGNAALAAHGAGARVTGVDGSLRLLDVAGRRVPPARFVRGDATSLPFGTDRFDAAVSVFGVIFARPAERAAREMARTVRDGGCVVVTAWSPGGPVSEASALLRDALAQVRPPAGPPRANWGDAATLEALLGPYGDLEVTERDLAHEPVTPQEQWSRWESAHPLWINARRILEPSGEWDRLRRASVAVLADGGLATERARSYLMAVLTVGRARR